MFRFGVSVVSCASAASLKLTLNELKFLCIGFLLWDQRLPLDMSSNKLRL